VANGAGVRPPPMSVPKSSVKLISGPYATSPRRERINRRLNNLPEHLWVGSGPIMTNDTGSGTEPLRDRLSGNPGIDR
jgi:hypothetical protein